MIRQRTILALTAAAIAVLSFTAASAQAATPAPNLALHTLATPTSFSEADNVPCNKTIGIPINVSSCDEYQVTAAETGAVVTKAGATITLTDTLPAGLEVKGIQVELKRLNTTAIELTSDCVIESGSTVKCAFHFPKKVLDPTSGNDITLTGVKPDEALVLLIATNVGPGAKSGEQNVASVSGGGSSPSEIATPLVLDTTPLFGLESPIAALNAADGSPDTTAGDHPYEFRTRLDLNNVIRSSPLGAIEATSVKDPRDVIVDLPPGLLGAATATPYCPLAQLSSLAGCPSDTRVGQIITSPVSNASVNGSIYNIVPEAGVAAEFGFQDLLDNVHVIYASVAPSVEASAEGEYVTRATTREIPQIPLTDVTATFFGEPQAKNNGPEAPPMFSNAADCTGRPLTTHIYTDAWQAPGTYNADGSPDLEDPNWVSATASSPAVEGCEALRFEPTLTATPETTHADSPTGFNVNIHVPQPEGAEELATPPLKDAVVTLPEGMTVNPSSANGLQACSLAQVGISLAGLPNASAPACPEASKIGTVELETPALPSEVCKENGPDPQFRNLSECPESAEREKVPLKGSIYVARQLENPFGSLLAIYIVVNDPRTGVIVKLAGEVKASETTGQLTTTVRNSPQFPFSELRTHFFSGDTAALRTPAACGTYTVTSELTPWSAPESGPAGTPAGPFEVMAGADGGACSQPNTPAFSAGSEIPTAGAFSPLLVHLSRDDGSQSFSQITVTLPPGASGRLAGIPKCSDAQIAQAQARSGLGEGALEAAGHSCPADSAIGTVTVGAGAGPKPFYVAGNAYLAGPYKGAPFSAVFITPAVAGPFDLGVVAVRAGLFIDPATAQVTTKADPLPTILHGVPLDIRSIVVDVNRPGFTLNPTSCNPMIVTGQETSTLGQAALLSSRFQVGGCQSLKFSPAFTVSTTGKTSKASGASLGVKVAYPAGSLGLQANIARVDLQLPKQLPARLTTLQKACTEAQFDTNPAGCPVASMIGSAKAITPLLSGPLVGPAILVSHGGAAFPDVEFLLQGEGVEVVLDGKTQIKQGITYSHFETVPDAPIATFETSFPEGPYSVLATNLPVSAKNSLCGQALTLPTTLTAQNGAVLSQTTRATVTGCPKVRALTRAQQLAKALKVCKKDKNRHKRAKCVTQTRKRYGPQAKKKTKAKSEPKVKGGK